MVEAVSFKVKSVLNKVKSLSNTTEIMDEVTALGHNAILYKIHTFSR